MERACVRACVRPSPLLYSTLLRASVDSSALFRSAFLRPAFQSQAFLSRWFTARACSTNRSRHSFWMHSLRISAFAMPRFARLSAIRNICNQQRCANPTPPHVTHVIGRARERGPRHARQGFGGEGHWSRKEKKEPNTAVETTEKKGSFTSPVAREQSVLFLLFARTQGHRSRSRLA